jgi:hypothetical protein
MKNKKKQCARGYFYIVAAIKKASDGSKGNVRDGERKGMRWSEMIKKEGREESKRRGASFYVSIVRTIQH